MKKILLQLDTDAHFSSFDAITALDAGVDHLLSYSHVNTSNVIPLVQGGIFTRSPKYLQNTAIFVGGSDVEAGEEVFQKIRECFFGPMQVSAMMDSSGCNTTATAAVRTIQKHIDLSDTKALVLGGTGPVGKRVTALLAANGAEVAITSRSLAKAKRVCTQIEHQPYAIQPYEVSNPSELAAILPGKNVVISAGAAGAQLTSLEQIRQYPEIVLAMDLNAVPPLGIQGIESGYKDKVIETLHCYGAVGIGGLKMKIHHELIGQMFKSNRLSLDTDQIFSISENVR